ncbi:hypothetical protein N865_05910 [Intrasporangium oryzae NRRL B-24470]|uniref:Uncharacterized protein n=1 Tax=Intrasporangium oryzae NRRL B-24470 TaxID=1386089 RepID=W9GAQ8_9MICO|nr:hypothetical protein [Intrasporangium oryzae]EWT00954.1 hypothetical protein N865_05910 [Intrasporangium oryzae NRRL B-24470]
MASDLTSDDLAAIASAEAGEAVPADVDPVDLDAPSRWTDAPTVRVWPLTPEDSVLHAAALAVYLAERTIVAEAEEP